ncbi:MAG: sigma-70 family RNA polymerase sigma factor [Planctomycetota bacterium]
MPDSIPQLVDHLFRHQAGRLVSHLVRSLGPAHVDLAEDVVQDALIAALRRWPFDGVPDEPAAWLYRVARNRAVDVLRRHQTLRTKLEVFESDSTALTDDETPARFDDELDDDVLRMIFACSHPSIPDDARAPLTLKLVCGFDVSEIARAFLTTETTMAQRIVRAKRRLRAGDIEIEVPGPKAIDERLSSVLDVIYLLFNEGYAAHQGENLVRADLVDEAIRLGSLIVTRDATARPEAHALMSLMLLHGARLPARVDDEGRLVLLDDQDRLQWDAPSITMGLRHLELAQAGEELSAFHVQAAIAACHAIAPSPDATDWPQILAYYDIMMARFPSPVVQLNRSVAVAMVHGPDRGLETIDAIDATALSGYYLLPATRAELLRRAGRTQDAVRAYDAALKLVSTTPERRFLEKRVEDLS